MTTEKMLKGLREGEFQIHQAAVAQHHHKEAQTPLRGAHGQGAIAAPVDLSALTGGKGQREVGRLLRGADLAYVIGEDTVAAVIALLAAVGKFASRSRDGCPASARYRLCKDPICCAVGLNGAPGSGSATRPATWPRCGDADPRRWRFAARSGFGTDEDL